MSEIADMYEGKCVDRAISTMRLALGYKSGLPKNNWSEITTSDRDVTTVIEMLDISFPGREIKTWCTNENWEKAKTENTNFMGRSAICNRESNSYLFAFSYHGDTNGHMVVGWPVAYGEKEIGLIVGVMI